MGRSSRRHWHFSTHTLEGYYSFLDLNRHEPQGGAGHLVSVVKAFAGAGITNLIIALFDNDTAAREAVRALRP